MINLHKELAGTGIQAAHIGIDVAIGSSDAVVPGFPTAPAGQISPVYWELHTTNRDEAEHVFRL